MAWNPPQRGDVLRVRLDPVEGHEQAGTRPVLTISSDVINQHSPVILVACITSQKVQRVFPFEAVIELPEGGLAISDMLAQIALGIEEQRVRVTMDLVDPPESWSRLGHDYRVIVHVTVWNSNNVLTVPVGALFRKGDEWAVFAVQDGRARVTSVKIGNRNNRTAEVSSGLSEGDRVVLHPSDRVKDGVAVAQRETR